MRERLKSPIAYVTMSLWAKGCMLDACVCVF